MGWFQVNKKITFFLFLAVFAWATTFSFAESDPPTNRVSMKKARATALRVAPGKVRDFEFKIRKEKWVYYFKIIGKDHRIHYLVVDAVTGKVISKASDPLPVETKAVPTPSPAPNHKK